jgi:solute carrier family 24 (sodium/potassium/calcium exchanger), member 6
VQCRPITLPSASQCAHVLKSCPPSDTVLSVQYLQAYFCTTPSLRPLTFVGLLVWLAFLFSTLGISASDFFTPNLATISQLLHIDDNVAGVTLLAFGNGSPDVFSTFSAMRADSASLAIGELVGAATFITSCVVGAMCIIKPFKVIKGAFLRDVGFFTVAVGLLLAILWDGKIYGWEAGTMVLLYVVYALTVIGGSWWMKRRSRRRRVEEMARAEYRDDPDEVDGPDTFAEPYRDERRLDFYFPHI